MLDIAVPFPELRFRMWSLRRHRKKTRAPALGIGFILGELLATCPDLHQCGRLSPFACQLTGSSGDRVGRERTWQG